MKLVHLSYYERDVDFAGTPFTEQETINVPLVCIDWYSHYHEQLGKGQ